MTISDQEKIRIGATLDFCWRLNINSQMKCQEIFQALNRAWNNHYVERREENNSNDDSTKMRQFMQVILPNNKISVFASAKCIQDLAEVDPPIHNDFIVGDYQGAPFNPQQMTDLPAEVTQTAITPHVEFAKYLGLVRENPNSKNTREFRNKLCRLLYVVRSNIAHGSKSNYEGSERNELICEIVYRILLEICNEVLGNGLRKIAAYGELKREGALFFPLVENNGGRYICDGTLNGQLNFADNTLIYNPEAEFSSFDAEIMEFDTFDSLHRIDIVECMPRVLRPYYQSETLVGFAWVYCSLLSIHDLKGPLLSWDRHERFRDKAKTFLYSLVMIENRYRELPRVSTNPIMKIYGGFSIKFGQQISFQQSTTNGLLITPHAHALIEFLDEICRTYQAIFNHEGDLIPFSAKIYAGIETVHWEQKSLFDRNAGGMSQSDENFIAKDIVCMIIECVAIWISDQMADDDLLVWTEIKNTVH